jgi:2-aminoadipate transaminase
MRPGVLSLAGGLPASETFPVEAFASALRMAGAQALQYDWPEGRAGLRSRIAARLAKRGARVDPGDVIVTSGAQQAIDLATRLVAPEAGCVWVPEECYPAALELFRARGLRLSTDPEGATLSYAMPLVGNPRGNALDGTERSALLERSPFIIEDDAYAELAFDGTCGPPLFAEAPERVAHVGTFSKTLCPGLRVGWLVVPPAYREAARRAKQVMDLQANGLAQSVVERFLALYDFDRHIGKLREHYERRAAALAEAIRQELPSFRFQEPRGGFSLWVESDLPGDDAELLTEALRHGVSIDPGGDFRASEASTPLAMRLSFSSLPVASMPEAAKRLAKAVAAYAARHGECSRSSHGHDAHVQQEAAPTGHETAPPSATQGCDEAHPSEERSGRAATAASR